MSAILTPLKKRAVKKNNKKKGESQDHERKYAFGIRFNWNTGST